MKIRIELNARRLWDVYAGGEWLCSTREPLQEAARRLLARGVPLDEVLELEQAETGRVSLRTTVGQAAGIKAVA